MTDIRVLRTAKATLTRTFYLDEAGTDATGSVAVSITRMDGSLVQSGVATGPDVNHGYAFTFAGRDVLDELTVTWSATVGGDAIVVDQDRIEVVGGFYFGLAEGRATDQALSNVSRYPTAKLIEARTATEDECERITDQAWVPRFCRETLSGNDRGALVLSHTMVRAIRAVTLNGVAADPAWVAGLGFSDLGLIYRPSGGWGARSLIGSRNVVVEYEHGHDRPNPDIVRGAKLRFKSLAMASQSALSDRAERTITVDQSGSSTYYGSPKNDRTGIPETDAAYHRHPSPRPGFG